MKTSKNILNLFFHVSYTFLGGNKDDDVTEVHIFENSYNTRSKRKIRTSNSPYTFILHRKIQILVIQLPISKILHLPFFNQSRIWFCGKYEENKS